MKSKQVSVVKFSDSSISKYFLAFSSLPNGALRKDSIFSLSPLSLSLSNKHKTSLWFSRKRERERERVMNDLSNASSIQSHCYSCKPIPPQVLYVLVPLFFTGLAVSLFILIAVHNAFFFVSLLFLSTLVAAFLIWNTVNWRQRRALFYYLRSFAESDLRRARHGQLVKITGVTAFLILLSRFCLFGFYV